MINKLTNKKNLTRKKKIKKKKNMLTMAIMRIFKKDATRWKIFYKIKQKN